MGLNDKTPEMRDNPKIELLTVDFYEADVGWLFYKLTTGQQSFEDRFSDVYDPLPDLKHWLEAISIGVQQTSFKYDNEGNHIKYDFERVSWDREFLTISEAYKDGEVFIKANIDRQQMVKAFYLGLLNFANSDKYSPIDWEVVYLKERLCNALNLDEETLVALLVNFNKNQLGEILSMAEPRYLYSGPESDDRTEELNIFLQNIMDKDKGVSKEFKNVKTAIEWNIPDDYNFWATDKKREFVIECINERTDGFDGMKIDDFRSPIIEKYLSNK